MTDRVQHNWRRAAVALFVAALSLAFTGVASAQSFQANVTFTGTVPMVKAGGCPNGAFFCGTANIAGYGPANWNLYVDGNNIVDSACGTTYTATTYFTLVNDPGSTLVLDESGDLCGLGHNGAAYRGYFAGGSKDYGRPYEVVGGWTVDPSSTGVFAGRSGSGTDTIHVSGAHVAGSYSGTIG